MATSAITFRQRWRYRIDKIGALGNDGDANYGVKLIPLKDSEVTLTEQDSLVVVAEDDR